jgi:hypothetical protein
LKEINKLKSNPIKEIEGLRELDKAIQQENNTKNNCIIGSTKGAAGNHKRDQ